jgi:8-oxo-dGTP pyrophosphatase MutT (NUDIX family)
MRKRKVQSILFYCDANKIKYFLLLKMNKRRGLFWQNVTGGVEEDELFINAALREAQEETSLYANNIQNVIESDYEFEFHDQWSNDVQEKVFFIQCRNKWDVKLDPSEHIDFRWCHQDDINETSVKFKSNYEALIGAIKLKC